MRMAYLVKTYTILPVIRGKTDQRNGFDLVIQSTKTPLPKAQLYKCMPPGISFKLEEFSSNATLTLSVSCEWQFTQSLGLLCHGTSYSN